MQKKTTQKKKRFKRTRRFFRVLKRIPNNLRRQPKIATKLYGLGVLKKVCQKTRTGFLRYKVYSIASDFRIADFGNLKRGRILVRTDPEKMNSLQSTPDWASLPRTHFEINSSSPAITQREIKEWMQKHSRSKKGDAKLVFVVHKVPDLIEYKDNIRINVDLRKGMIWITKIPIAGIAFRIGLGPEYDYSMKVARFFGEPVLTKEKKAELIEVAGSEKTAEKILRVVSELIVFGRKTNQPVFETSAVTYKGNPEMPEFYDLLFGKKETYDLLS